MNDIPTNDLQEQIQELTAALDRSEKRQRESGRLSRLHTAKLAIITEDRNAWRDACKELLAALLRFECPTCHGAKRFTLQCDACFLGKPEHCTCPAEKYIPCPVCQSEACQKDLYDQRERALAAVKAG